jgi:hypothetical protein
MQQCGYEIINFILLIPGVCLRIPIVVNTDGQNRWCTLNQSAQLLNDPI